jgi:hypothetical protein
MDVMKVRRKKTEEAAGRTDKSKEYGDHMKKQSPQKRKNQKRKEQYGGIKENLKTKEQNINNARTNRL